MRPRNKTDREIVERFNRRGLTRAEVVPDDVRRWAERAVVKPAAMASGRKAWCTACGEYFPLDASTVKEGRAMTCPHCGARIIVRRTRKRKVSEEGFFQQLDTDGDLQIIRTYEWFYNARVGKKGEPVFKHVYDLWLTEGFESRWRFSVAMVYSGYEDRFGWGNLELRSDYKLCGDPARGWNVTDVYPRIKLQPWLSTLDIRRPWMGHDLYDLIIGIMCGGSSETVWKIRRFNPSICRYYFEHAPNTEQYYRQVCLAHRHGYRCKDAATWFDHLRMLEHEGRDIHNPRLIFPKNLQAEHQRLLDAIERRRQAEERRREQERLIREEQQRLERQKQDNKENIAYRKRLGKALGVVVAKGDIEIRPLQDMQDFYEQGRDLHQCVYSARYYEHADAIILCARVNGERTETVEVFLKDGRIGQCRGIHNQNSKRHDDILDLVRSSVTKFTRAVGRPAKTAKTEAI